MRAGRKPSDVAAVLVPAVALESAPRNGEPTAWHMSWVRPSATQSSKQRRGAPPHSERIGSGAYSVLRSHKYASARSFRTAVTKSGWKPPAATHSSGDSFLAAVCAQATPDLVSRCRHSM